MSPAPRVLNLGEGAVFGYPQSMNSGGQVVGSVYLEDGTSRAVVWPAGSPDPTYLPTFGGALNNYAMDINEAGVIVGAASRPGENGEVGGFIYRDG